MHKIDATSPLWDLSAHKLKKEHFEIIIIFEGTVESTSSFTQVVNDCSINCIPNILLLVLTHLYFPHLLMDILEGGGVGGEGGYVEVGFICQAAI